MKDEHVANSSFLLFFPVQKSWWHWTCSSNKKNEIKQICKYSVNIVIISIHLSSQNTETISSLHTCWLGCCLKVILVIIIITLAAGSAQNIHTPIFY